MDGNQRKLFSYYEPERMATCLLRVCRPTSIYAGQLLPARYFGPSTWVGQQLQPEAFGFAQTDVFLGPISGHSWRTTRGLTTSREDSPQAGIGYISARRLFGFSIASATKRRKPAAVPPSHTRWSKVSVSSVTLRTANSPFTTHGLSMIRPTPRMATSDG
jgi:hypothetical protein